MRPYLEDSDFQLWNGDAREVLRELPAESVHMCVTSPPFFGLRDYQTGTWEGGDAECDHVKPRNEKQLASSGLNLARDRENAHSHQEKAASGL